MTGLAAAALMLPESVSCTTPCCSTCTYTHIYSWPGDGSIPSKVLCFLFDAGGNCDCEMYPSHAGLKATSFAMAWCMWILPHSSVD
jgi:hypothetical protein